MTSSISDNPNNIFGSETAVGLAEHLATQKPLTVKIGFDPTAPDLHLGHYVVLRGVRKFQDAGHNVVVIVGDFTAAIGDPSGRNKLRPPLSRDTIKENAKTYLDQVFLVLDKNKTQVRFNSEWLDKINMVEILALMATQTLSQMLVRHDFQQRFQAQSPIFMHELMYPLMQALDSVAIEAHVEVGGTDQTFNLMMGREIQKSKHQKEQAVLTYPLLVGLDGVHKMSKSLANHIGLTDTPEDKFGKIMSLSDETMWNYFTVLFDKSAAEVESLKTSGRNPKLIKMELAQSVVEIFHTSEAAQNARAQFEARFSQKDVSQAELVEVKMEGEQILLSHLIRQLDMAQSVSDANRKIEQNGVRVNEAKVSDKKTLLQKGDEVILQVGKLHLKKVRLR